MAKKKRQNPDEINDLGPVTKQNKLDKIIVPCGDDYYNAHRYLPEIRYGRISFEVFAKNHDRRRELGLPVILPDPV